jgi:hypothetical protein
VIWPKGVVAPVIIASEIDVLPAEWREMHQVVGLRPHALARQVIDRSQQEHGIPQNAGDHDEIQAARTIALVFMGSVADFAETIEEHRAVARASINAWPIRAYSRTLSLMTFPLR